MLKDLRPGEVKSASGYITRKGQRSILPQGNLVKNSWSIFEKREVGACEKKLPCPISPSQPESTCSCWGRQLPAHQLLSPSSPCSLLLCWRTFSSSLPTLHEYTGVNRKWRGAHVPGPPSTSGEWELVDNAQGDDYEVCSTWLLRGSPGSSGALSSNLLIDVWVTGFLPPLCSRCLKSAPKDYHQENCLYSSFCLRTSFGRNPS